MKKSLSILSAASLSLSSMTAHAENYGSSLNDYLDTANIVRKVLDNRIINSSEKPVESIIAQIRGISAAVEEIKDRGDYSSDEYQIMQEIHCLLQENRIIIQQNFLVNENEVSSWKIN